MTNESERRIFAIHAGSIVAHANQLVPAFFDYNLDRRCAGTERILGALLYDRRRALDDFAGRNLISDGARQDFYQRQAVTNPFRRVEVLGRSFAGSFPARPFPLSPLRSGSARLAPHSFR